MTTPAARGREETSGGGETQAATPRILAADSEQRQRDDSKTEEGRGTRKEREETGAVERTTQEGDEEAAADESGEIWIQEEERKAAAALTGDMEHRKARIAMNAAILQMPWLWENTGVPTEGSRIEESERALTTAGGTGGDLELQEQLSADGHTDEAQEMEVDGPVVHRTAQRTTNTSWAVGTNIAPQHCYLVQAAYDPQRRYRPGEEVALITGQRWHQFRIAEMRHGTIGIEDENLSRSMLELRHGNGQPLTWELHGMIRQLYTQCSRRPGEVIGPRDTIHIRSHRPQTSMHWEGDLVAVPFIWATGQQGFRYARVCAKDALTEASSKGLYQLDGGAHNPKMLRTRGSFYAIDRTSPPRARLEEEDIQEVPGRGEAWTQDEWTGPADEDTKDAGRARLEKAVKEHKRTDL